MDLLSTKIAYASFDSFLANVNSMIINPLIAFLFALAVVYFLYGGLEFIMNQENEEKKTTGKSHMLWGIVGITIMLGVWTIMGMIIRTFNIEGVKVDEGKVEVTLPTPEPASTP
jgi:uncharacterized membrane protein YidH (DUF202 family)